MTNRFTLVLLHFDACLPWFTIMTKGITREVLWFTVLSSRIVRFVFAVRSIVFLRFAALLRRRFGSLGRRVSRFRASLSRFAIEIAGIDRQFPPTLLLGRSLPPASLRATAGARAAPLLALSIRRFGRRYVRYIDVEGALALFSLQGQRKRFHATDAAGNGPLCAAVFLAIDALVASRLSVVAVLSAPLGVGGAGPTAPLVAASQGADVVVHRAEEVPQERLGRRGARQGPRLW